MWVWSNTSSRIRVKNACTSFEEFISFLHELRCEIDLLEFAHYDVMNIGSIGVEDFGYSVVAGANVQRMQYFIDRISKLASSDIGAAGQRVSKQEFMSFCRLLKHGDTKFQEKVRKHAGDGGRIDMAHFLKLALDCGVILSDIQVRIIFFSFLMLTGTESYLQLNFRCRLPLGLAQRKQKSMCNAINVDAVSAVSTCRNSMKNLSMVSYMVW